MGSWAGGKGRSLVCLAVQLLVLDLASFERRSLSLGCVALSRAGYWMIGVHADDEAGALTLFLKRTARCGFSLRSTTILCELARLWCTA